MPLPASGAISLDAMHQEVGGTANTNCSINDTDIRGLISKGAGATSSFNEFYGASFGNANYGKTDVVPRINTSGAGISTTTNMVYYSNDNYDNQSSTTSATANEANVFHSDDSSFTDSNGDTVRLIRIRALIQKTAQFMVNTEGDTRTNNNWSLNMFGVTITPAQNFTYGGVTYTAATSFYRTAGTASNFTNVAGNEVAAGVTEYYWNRTTAPVGSNALPTGTQDWTIT